MALPVCEATGAAVAGFVLAALGRCGDSKPTPTATRADYPAIRRGASQVFARKIQKADAAIFAHTGVEIERRTLLTHCSSGFVRL